MDEIGSDGKSREAVRAAAFISALLIAQQVAGRATRDALFLSTFSVASLPGVMMAAALGSIVAVLGWSRVLSRRSPLDVMPQAATAAALLLLVEFGVSFGSPRAGAILLYMHMAVFGSTLVSGFWSVVNERFDPYSAKAAVGRIAAGASAGGIAGGLLAVAVSRVFPAAAMLLLMAALMVGAAVGLRRLAHGRSPESLPGQESAPSAVATLRGVSYLRDVGIVVTLGALTETLLEYVLKAQAAAELSQESQFLTLFALLNTAQSALSLGVQTAFTRSSLSALGISGTVAVRPAVTLALALVGLVDPRMWAGALARLSHEVSSNSLFRSGYELLYTPLSEAEKRPTKSVIDVGFDKLGSLAGGMVVLGVASFFTTGTVRVLLGLSALFCIAALALTGRLHRGYIASLEQSLRAGKVRLDPAEIPDDATRNTHAQTSLALDREKLLRDIEAFRAHTPAPGADRSDDLTLRAITDLRSGDVERVRHVVRGVPLPDAALVPHLITLLARDDLFLEVLRPLRRAAPLVTGQLVDALLDRRQAAAVRRRVARALKGCETQRAVDGLRAGLEDPQLEVRAECALSLLAIAGRRPELTVPAPAVFGMAVRELGTDADASSEILPHVFTLLSLVLDREPLRIAWWALRAGDPALRGTALEYLDNVLPETLRVVLFPRLGEWTTQGRSSRPHEAVIDDLMRSSESIDLGRAFAGSRRRRPE